jgi:hypothetical protein
MGRGRRPASGPATPHGKLRVSSHVLSLSSRPRARKLIPQGVTPLAFVPMLPVAPGEPSTTVRVTVRFGVSGPDRERAEELADRIEAKLKAFHTDQGGSHEENPHGLKWTIDEYANGEQHRCLNFLLPVRWRIDYEQRTCPEFKPFAGQMEQLTERAGSLLAPQVVVDFYKGVPASGNFSFALRNKTYLAEWDRHRRSERVPAP